MSDQLVTVRPARILCVDDEVLVLKALDRLFHKDGFQIELANNGKEGLRILEQQPIDLVISDMRMPEMDGVQFLEMVAQRWPGVIRILLTGVADLDTITSAVNKGGIYGYCRKPWDIEELKALVANGLQHKRLIEERQQLFDIINRQNERLKDCNLQLEAKVEQRTAQLRDSLRKLDKMHQSLNNAQRMAHLGNWEWEQAGKTFRCSEEAARILGVDGREHKFCYKKLLDLIYPDDRDEFRSFLRNLSTHGGINELVHRIIRSDGQVRTLRHRAELIFDSANRCHAIHAVLHDITELQQAEIQSARMGRIFEHSWNEFYVIDADTLNFIDVSDGACQNLGYSAAEIFRLTLFELMPTLTRRHFAALTGPLLDGGKKYISFESECRRKDHTHYPVEVRLQLCHEDKPPVFLAISQDISERKRYIEELERKALYDALTGLPNRTLMQEKLQQALLLAQRENACLAVIIIDVVRLREINDLLGHQNGDLVLQGVAQRLAQALRKSDSLARLGADEFVIVMPHVSRGHLHQIAEKLQQLFEPPFIIEDIPLELEAAIGIAHFPEHGNNATVLLQHADIAMNIAKQETLGFNIYQSQDDPYSVRRLKLHGELRRAIKERKLTVHYQPKIHLKSDRIVAVEALARWPHPLEGMISPVDFIPMVEHSGLIRPFTHWLFERTIQQSRAWSEQGIDVRIAVNLSTRNLLDPLLVENVFSLLQIHRVSADRILLEITESAIMSRPEQALKILMKLHALGLQMSIDDFGTGYSSLAYLKQLPVSELKIDRSFVSEMTRNESDATIVGSTVGLAHNLGLSVVAEGVEDRATLDMLTRLQCDMAQGYYLSHPLPPEQVTDLLLKQTVKQGR